MALAKIIQNSNVVQRMALQYYVRSTTNGNLKVFKESCRPSLHPWHLLDFNVKSTQTHSRKFHTGNYFFKSASQIIKNPQSYDYIIVGAGSAGCVLANRLSANKVNTVNLFEAGPTDKTWTIDMPAALMYNLCHDKYNWFYTTKAQKHINNREMYCPRGRVLGGSSSLNAMVYVRGHPYDYDRWEREGATGWSYSHCLPYFKKSQTHELGEDLYRGGCGPLHVSRSKVNGILHRTWIEAGKQAGYSFTGDLNGYKQEGFGEYDLTIHKGERWSTSKAYLKPVSKNNNLTVSTNSLVTKILFEGKKAIGIEILNKNRKLENVMANKEVVLSGGAINSPQLLMLSGVGDANELKKHSIPIVHHLPGVGKNLQDHLEMYIQYKCKKPITLYSAQWKFPHNMIRIGLQWFIFKTGLAATSHLDSGGFIRSEASVSHPDIQFHFLPGMVVDHGRQVGQMHAFQVHVGPLRSQSVGSILLSSNDPRKHPIIDPNYCSVERDFWEFRQCVRLSREIFAQPAFNEFKSEEILPGPDIQSDSQIDQFIKSTIETAYHPSCTCRMGSSGDKYVVTDPKCRVVGLDNLRVVDASIMPSIISGNLNAAVIMMAEKASDIILNNDLTPQSENVPVWSPKYPSLQRERER